MKTRDLSKLGERTFTLNTGKQIPVSALRDKDVLSMAHKTSQRIVKCVVELLEWKKELERRGINKPEWLFDRSIFQNTNTSTILALNIFNGAEYHGDEEE